MEWEIVLASGSPRRRELLAMAGFQFRVDPADVDESVGDGETAAAYVRRLAVEKARVVAARSPGAVVLGADTSVVLGEQILGKPRDRGEAERMLRALAGRTHFVLTGVAVVTGSSDAAGQAKDAEQTRNAEQTKDAEQTKNAELTHVESTAVMFGEIAEAELRRYLDSGDAMDKAGAYGIQGYAGRWVERIEGDYSNVVGLPVAATVKLLKSFGVE